MMKRSKKLLLLAVLSALVIPLLFAGTASAKYIGDGAVPNGVTGGWDLPADIGFCVTGIKSDGTMILDLTVGNNRSDCIAKTFSAYRTQAECRASDSAGANVEGAHYWTSTCVNPADNTGISLKNLDRTSSMCAQLGGVMRNQCTSSWTAMGPAWSAAPVSSTPGASEGFCSTRISLDNFDATTCPTTTFGYSWTGTQCVYAYGVQGKFAGIIPRGSTTPGPAVKMDGTTYAVVGANIDLSSMAQGLCLFNGLSFSPHTLAGGTASVPTTNPAGSTIATPITQVRAGCLSCHNEVTQYNGYKARWSASSYLKQGHRNMLRKVTPGQNWAGPNADGVIEVYNSAAAGQTLDFAAGTATGTYGTMPLMYLFGDWMAPAPDGLDTVVWKGTTAAYNGGGGYSCAACHATGWRNENTAVGLCTVSTATTAATCATAGGTWYPASGAQGYGIGGAEPMASFPAYAAAGPPANIPGITGQWDWDGINCNRCHRVAYDPTLPLNSGGYNAPEGFTTHETDIFNAPDIMNTCFGCHQSIAKAGNGLSGANDIADVTKLPVKNNKTAPAYQPEFNSHVIGAEFLGSPHAKYTGGIVPNALGKYDLAAGGTFASAFKGKICRSSTAIGGGSLLETRADGHAIATLADCNRANGKAVGDETSYGYWQDEDQGSCITCHNVHQSLFVADAVEPLRRECTTCHVGNAGGYETVPKVTYGGWGFINHPDSALTPVGIANAAGVESKACETCHMPKATSGGFPMHLWRVNSDPNYRTFPTALEFGIGGTATKKVGNTSPDGSYATATWVDVDYACGQCHGGGPDEANPVYAVADRVVAGAMYYPKATLAAFAAGVHDGTYPPPTANVAPVAGFTAALDPNTWVATLTNTTTDEDLPTVTYAVNWGDGNSNSYTNLTTATHTYNTEGTFTITMKATDSAGLFSNATGSVTAATFQIPVTVTAGTGAVSANSVLLTLKRGTVAIANYTTPASGTGPFSYSFTGLKPGNTYSVTAYKYGAVFAAPNPITAITVGPDAATQNFTTVKTKFSITSTAKGSGGANLSGVTITVKNASNVTVAQGTTNASGVYATNMNLSAGTYSVTAYKAGRLFTGSTPQSITFANGDADGTLTFTSTTP